MLLKDNTSFAHHQTFMQKKESGIIPNSQNEKANSAFKTIAL